MKMKAKYNNINDLSDAMRSDTPDGPEIHPDLVTLYEDGGAIYIYHINGNLLYENEIDPIEQILADVLGIELGAK